MMAAHRHPTKKLVQVWGWANLGECFRLVLEVWRKKRWVTGQVDR